LTRILRGLIRSIINPTNAQGVLAMLAAVALTACALPAFRASRLDPMEILREE